jgi:hypothetical protein
MLARAPGDVAHANVAQTKRSPSPAGFTPPGLGQRGSAPGYAGSERAPRSHQPTARRHGPQAASSLVASICSRLAHLSPPGKGRRPDWASRAARIGPLPGDQATVPPQDGARRDQPVRPQPSRQEPDQRGQHRAVGPVPPGPGQVTRSTATSCRSTSSSASLNAGERPSRTSQQAARKSGRADATTRPVIMPGSHAAPIAPGHGHRPASGTPQAHRCSSQAGQASGTPQEDRAGEGVRALVA